MAGEVIGPRWKPITTTVVLNGCALKLPSKHLCLHPQISAVPSLHQPSFLLLEVAMNAETCNWLKYQEYTVVKCLALNGTVLPPSRRLGEH